MILNRSTDAHVVDRVSESNRSDTLYFRTPPSFEDARVFLRRGYDYVRESPAYQRRVRSLVPSSTWKKLFGAAPGAPAA